LGRRDRIRARPRALVHVHISEVIMEATLSHEKLDAYQVAVQFLAWSTHLVRSLPRGHAALADQLRRASLSIPLSIAEAVGKTAGPDRARYFAYARGSSLECAAILDACNVLGLIDKDASSPGKQLLVRLASMLSKLCR